MITQMEFRHFNTYYFCYIINNLVVHSSLETVSSMSEFFDYLSGIEEREDFSKVSYLDEFVEFCVEKLFFEDTRNYIYEFLGVVEEEGFDKVIQEQDTKCFFKTKTFPQAYRYMLMEKAIIEHVGVMECFRDWIVENKNSLDIEDELAVVQEYDRYLKETYWDEVINPIIHEVVYLLFQNRNFLLEFNIMMSDALPGKSQRVTIPQWVKRVVNHRDRGKCVICGKNLTEEYDIEEERERQYDHIVPLADGGINDVSNMQLMCRGCNKKKDTQTYTGNRYTLWYTWEEL